MYHTLSLAEMAAGLRAGQFSSVELTEHYLQRIRDYNDELNAYITVCDELALAQARDADQSIKGGNAGPLTGIPYAHKDIFCTDGVLTSAGSKMLANFISPYDATVTSRLRDAGMVMLGKTNMDEFAMGSSNENSFFGPVSNPWDLSRVPGGSSGGSAAAVAAGLAPLATGTDTGGSIRQPAAFCGITGLKPTYGSVSRYGMIAFASSLDQGGPMARTAEEAGRLLAVMRGHDPLDSTSMKNTSPAAVKPVSELRVGLPQRMFEALDDSVAAGMDQVRQSLETIGARIVDIELPHAELAIAAYYIIAPAEASSNLSRYDGVRFGFRCESPSDLNDLYTRSRAEGFGAEVKRRIMIGTYVLSAGYYDAYYRQAQQVRRLVREDFNAAFGDVDVILAPTTPAPAFALGEKTGDPVAMYQTDIFTVPASLAGLPAISIPALHDATLPVSAQFIAPHFHDDLLVELCSQLQSREDFAWRGPEPYFISSGQ